MVTSYVPLSSRRTQRIAPPTSSLTGCAQSCLCHTSLTLQPIYQMRSVSLLRTPTPTQTASTDSNSGQKDGLSSSCSGQYPPRGGTTQRTTLSASLCSACLSRTALWLLQPGGQHCHRTSGSPSLPWRDQGSQSGTGDPG